MSDATLAAAAPVYLRPKEAAERYNLGLRTVYDLMDAREIDRIEIRTPGSRRPGLRTTVASVDAYLARNTTAAAS